MIFFTDLDNTIIYSYKHDIGRDKINVEIYQGREISFITQSTHEYLKNLKENILVVPTSTRTVEQYERIDLEAGSFKYALVCNGGILLENGIKADGWYRQSLREIEESNGEIEKGLKLLEDNPLRTFEVRYIEKLFVFTKCDSPELVVSQLENELDGSYVDVFNNGSKVYIVPKSLNKGRAIERFMEYMHESFAVAAGDSRFDIPMLKAADIGLAPAGFKEEFNIDFAVEEMEGKKVFSDELLERCMKLCNII